MTKKQYFEELGGFDEGIFMYMEEIDLLLRAAKKNLHTWFYPGARFIHLGSASSRGKTYPILQVYRGFLYLYKKHYSPFKLVILKCMLQLKAVTALLIGHITHNSYLIQTYGKAKELVTMD
jgi:GT2 family glycosyltransferase